MSSIPFNWFHCFYFAFIYIHITCVSYISFNSWDDKSVNQSYLGGGGIINSNFKSYILKNITIRRSFLTIIVRAKIILQ